MQLNNKVSFSFGSGLLQKLSTFYSFNEITLIAPAGHTTNYLIERFIRIFGIIMFYILNISFWKLVSSYPSNFSTNIALNQKIILTFNEQIDPISANEAIKINYNDFIVKVRGKKVIIEPKSNWDSNYLVDIFYFLFLK